MSWRISILDKSPIAENESAAEALARTLRLAQLAEAAGFHRFWLAEHHNTPNWRVRRRNCLSPGSSARRSASAWVPAA